MKFGRSTMWLLAGTLLVGGCQQPAPRFSEQDRATVAGMFDSTVSYFRAKNFTGWAALYSDDGLIMPPNAGTVRGRAALIAWANAFPPVEQLSFANALVAGEGNMAYGTSGYVLKLQGLPADSGKQLVIFRRTAAGRWEAVAGAFNSDLPLPTAPAQPSSRR
jgi:ketosteroid isomerase-like protein